MKRVLAILLAIGVLGAFAAGCNKADEGTTTPPTNEKATGTETDGATKAPSTE